MRKLCLPLALCLALSACSAPSETHYHHLYGQRRPALSAPSEPPELSEASGLTAEEAREALAQALLERNDSYLSYDRETGFDADGIHYVWSDVFWKEDIPKDAVEDTEIYCFDLCYGPDADDQTEGAGNPMAGRLCASYGIGRDGESLWQYRQDLGEWEALPEFEN